MLREGRAGPVGERNGDEPLGERRACVLGGIEQKGPAIVGTARREQLDLDTGRQAAALHVAHASPPGHLPVGPQPRRTSVGAQTCRQQILA